MFERCPIVPVQKALIARLTADLAPAPTVPIYGYVPAGAIPPFVVLNQVKVADESTKTHGGGIVTYTISLFSKYEGLKEMGEVIDRILKSISDKALELESDFEHSGYTDLLEYEVVPVVLAGQLLQSADIPFAFHVTDKHTE